MLPGQCLETSAVHRLHLLHRGSYQAHGLHEGQGLGRASCKQAKGLPGRELPDRRWQPSERSGHQPVHLVAGLCLLRPEVSAQHRMRCLRPRLEAHGPGGRRRGRIGGSCEQAQGLPCGHRLQIGRQGPQRRAHEAVHLLTSLLRLRPQVLSQLGAEIQCPGSSCAIEALKLCGVRRSILGGIAIAVTQQTFLVGNDSRSCCLHREKRLAGKRMRVCFRILLLDVGVGQVPVVVILLGHDSRPRSFQKPLQDVSLDRVVRADGRLRLRLHIWGAGDLGGAGRGGRARRLGGQRLRRGGEYLAARRRLRRPSSPQPGKGTGEPRRREGPAEGLERRGLGRRAGGGRALRPVAGPEPAERTGHCRSSSAEALQRPALLADVRADLRAGRRRPEEILQPQRLLRREVHRLHPLLQRRGPRPQRRLPRPLRRLLLRRRRLPLRRRWLLWRHRLQLLLLRQPVFLPAIGASGPHLPTTTLSKPVWDPWLQTKNRWGQDRQDDSATAT
mmetsp:Transcript_18173/g.63835  ORF Transcript_18173/g.63835 Transcript_18173/m.63835 type:complete len:502 (-) Transcript_18173:2-1507(-)